MGAEPQNLHVAFFPLMAAGHMIPTLDIAKLLAAHNVKTTIITTPLNASTFTKPLERHNYDMPMGAPINIEIIPFPSKEAGLSEGAENFEHFTSNDMSVKFLKATELLEESLERVMEKHKPNCLVADMLLPFAADVAAKFNIPRLVFHGTNYFARCVMQAVMKYEPHKSVTNDDEEFIIPHLHHTIKLTRLQLPENTRQEKQDDELMAIIGRALESEEKSYGIIVNSFYELEPEYADCFRKVMGGKSWHIGPVSLCNRGIEAKFNRGKVSSIDEHECLKWLDSKNPDSVVYICFGSLAEISASQLHEIAMGLEDSGQDFVWVVRSGENGGWLPHGFEEKMQDKGLIIRGWAPQLVILDHEAVGGFVTHCGWNSTLEGISCGVPMITWPVFAEQFYNEKLVTEILKTGIGVGAKEWNRTVEVSVKRDDIREAIRRVMVGEEGLEIRSRAKKLKEMARKAVEEGGSSYSELSSLIQELSSYNHQ